MTSGRLMPAKCTSINISPGCGDGAGPSLTRMASAESSPTTPAERFFGQIKGATGQAYYTSKIGIHQDQQYKGNVFQPGEFAGFDAT